MSQQIHHIQKNKDILTTRALIIREIREFFWQQNFLEGETPSILRIPGQEPYLSPVELTIHNDRRQKHTAFLHTSPEYTLKKMLAAGFGNIFFLGKTFRDYESFGGTHNPEFTMLEWYQVHTDMFSVMDTLDSLMGRLIKMPSLSNSKFLISNFKEFQRITMKQLWQDTINVNLDNYLTQETMFELCKERGHNPKDDESYEDLFYRIFLNEIEPTLNIQHGVPQGGIPPCGTFIIYNYPAPMAALAKLSDTEQGYAERFEVYIGGMEIANAFSELTDSEEQLRRLQEEQALRKKLGKTVYDIDMDFVEAVGKMPKSAGIALGVDRLVQVLTGCKNIDDVLVLPASKLF